MTAPPLPARPAGGWLAEVASALSCLLNALAGGPRQATFSAWSAALAERGSRWGRARVALVDAVAGRGHCAAALAFHRAHRLAD